MLLSGSPTINEQTVSFFNDMYKTVQDVVIGNFASHQAASHHNIIV